MTHNLHYSIAFLIIRVVFGFRLIYGTLDNVTDWERMMEFKLFLETNGFPLPLVCAIVSVYLQFIAGISWIIGYQVKITSILMILNFLVAILGYHLVHGDDYLTTAPAIHLLSISIALLLCGPGKLSLDKKWRKQEFVRLDLQIVSLAFRFVT